ncbi:Probable pectinesterase 29 [Linum grandiflorum]
MEQHPSSCRRHPPSPRLARSRSTTEANNNAVLYPSTTSLSRSRRLDTVTCSKSTTKSRDPKTVAKTEPVLHPTRNHKDGLVRFLPRGDSAITGSARSKLRPNYNKQTSPLSPSAWALSPGRSTTSYFPTPPPPPPAATDTTKPKRRSSSGGGGGMSGVWKYFKKGSSTMAKEVQEECRRKFGVVNGTLVQWKFANAKAKAAEDAMEQAARAKLFHVWISIREKRKRVMQKRMEIQRMKVEEKLSRMMRWQLSLLTEWGKTERKNVEAVSRVSRKLVAVSLTVPLLDDVKLEKNLYLLTELTSSVDHQNDRLEEMEKIVDVLAHLLIVIVSFRLMLWIAICFLFFGIAQARPDPQSPPKTLVVDQSGDGDFTNVQSAIDSVPSENNRWITIQLKSGIYREQVQIPEDKPCIILKGEGQTTTQIVWDSHSTIDLRATSTFMSLADNIIVQDIGFVNSYNYPDQTKNRIMQAIAVMVAGDKTAFYKCGFSSVQDTLWDVEGRHYFKECTIEGAVDFIFGNGQSIYEDCAIKVIGGGYITAQAREKEEDTSGFVFKRCSITGIRGQMAYLGRPWRKYARVLFYKSELTDIVEPEGWDSWNVDGTDSTWMAST